MTTRSWQLRTVTGYLTHMLRRTLFVVVRAEKSVFTRILRKYFCVSIKPCTQLATVINCLKVIDFFVIQRASVYENCNCFKFYDVILTLNLLPNSFVFHKCRPFQSERINDFWANASAAMLFVKFHAGPKKSHLDF